jgi:hypothetical protein
MRGAGLRKLMAATRSGVSGDEGIKEIDSDWGIRYD